VELPHPAGLVVVRPQPLRPLLGSPAAAADRVDGQRTELVERETTVRVVLQHPLDAVQLGVTLGVVGLLPGLGALEGDALAIEDLAQPLPTDPHHPGRIVRQVLGELADAPMRERPAELLGPGLGRLDDERHVVVIDQAGTATRPLRVQGLHPEAVEVVDHLPDPVLRCLHELRDHRHRVPAARGQHDQRPPVTHHARLTLALTATDEPLQLAALLIGQTTHSHWFSHTNSVTANPDQRADPGDPVWSGH
jgi:hypothetical protein